jgi:hypothetical protein
VLGAATTRAAGDDAADRAQLHPQIVGGLAGAVHSLVVLRLGAIIGCRSHHAEVAKPSMRNSLLITFVLDRTLVTIATDTVALVGLASRTGGGYF